MEDEMFLGQKRGGKSRTIKATGRMQRTNAVVYRARPLSGGSLYFGGKVYARQHITTIDNERVGEDTKEGSYSWKKINV